MGKSLLQKFEESYVKYRRGVSWLVDSDENPWKGPDLKDSIDYAVQEITDSKKPVTDPEEFAMLRRFCELTVLASASTILRPCTLALSKCESPIERIFLCAFWVAAIDSGLTLESGIPAVLLQDGVGYGNPFGPNTITIEPQVKILSFRVDFRITYMNEGYDFIDGKHVKKTAKQELIVECDGHDFHEKTKQQAAKDKSRDRDLQCTGVPIFHFTGSEIWNDPLECASQVIGFLERNSR